MWFHSLFLRKRYWLKDFLVGQPMWKAYKEVMYISDINNVDIAEKIRIKRLFSFIDFATSNVSFYSTYKGKKLNEFPIINKQIIQSHYDQFLTPIDKIPGQKGNVHIQKTSGSTGIPFEVHQDTVCRIRRIATLKVENESIGFHSFEPMMHLRAASHYWGNGEFIIYNSDLNIYYVDNANLNNEKLSIIVNTIIRKKIKVIRGYMTTLDTITSFAVDNNIDFPHHPFFISVGEILLEPLRFRIVNKLHCHVISQYGNEENGIFGSSPIDGVGTNIVLNRANCFVEILKLDSDVPVEKGEIGRIVVTDFSNYAMPMIRYDTGDLASIGAISSDGIILSLENLSGRKTDLIFKTNGEPIDLWNSIPSEIYNNPNIRQWQFIQNGEKGYLLRLSLYEERLEFINLLKIELKKILGENAIIEVECVDEIPVLCSGKRKVVINNWTNKID